MPFRVQESYTAMKSRTSWTTGLTTDADASASMRKAQRGIISTSTTYARITSPHADKRALPRSVLVLCASCYNKPDTS